MAQSSPTNGGEQRTLCSWKEIAAFFGVTVRAVQGWEKTKGLPVRRSVGKKGRVSADIEELTRWRSEVLQVGRRATLFSASKLVVASVLCVPLLVIALVGVYLWNTGPGVAASCRLEPRSLVVVDAKGREVWRAPLPHPIDPLDYARLDPGWVWLGNLDQDREVETLFVYTPISNILHQIGSRLICFSEKGVKKWEYDPGKKVTDGQGTHHALHTIASLRVTLPAAGRNRQILVTSHHLWDHPNRFVVLNSRGDVEQEYWHPGFLPDLEAMDLDRDGVNEYLLAGVNNSFKTAVLVVLDARQAGGASHCTLTDEYRLEGFAAAQERDYLAFPRTCISLALEDYSSASLALTPEGIKVDVSQRQPGHPVSYLLRNDLSLLKAVWDIMLINLHRSMSLRQELDHQLTTAEMDEAWQIRYLRRNGQPAAKDPVTP